jgi:hypothetical protein
MGADDMRSVLWIVTILVVVSTLLQRSFRGPAIRRLGERLELKFNATALPLDLDITKASFFAPWDSVSNVLSGNFENRQMAVFDFHANHGDVGYKQTTAAVVSDSSIEPMSHLWKAAEIQCETIGNWIIMYRSREQLSVKAIPEFLTACRQLVDYLESSAGGVTRLPER